MKTYHAFVAFVREFMALYMADFEGVHVEGFYLPAEAAEGVVYYA